jgi:hypothetical protein
MKFKKNTNSLGKESKTKFKKSNVKLMPKHKLVSYFENEILLLKIIIINHEIIVIV